MNHYPFMLDLRNKKAVVIGGGRVALRKIRSLLKTEARIVVVSPEAVDGIQEIAGEGLLDWRRKRFEKEDLADASLVFAATNDSKVNEAAAKAVSPHQWVNVADNPELGNIHMPSVLERGRLKISVSTGGASPKLARKIRDELSETYDDSHGGYVEFLFECRGVIKRSDLSSQQKERLLIHLLEPKYREEVHQREMLMRLEQMIDEGQ
ncbi:MAG TPA: NAD(P)-binding protein [Bacillales bacterium]|nr:NAD(P)-binding protein [Bacillales bacterium]